MALEIERVRICVPHLFEQAPAAPGKLKVAPAQGVHTVEPGEYLSRRRC
jgi:hypothetical protein